MRELRTNTAVIVTVGPFYDKTDGVTIETGLTITNERITLTADTDDGSAPTNILDNVTGATSGTDNDLNYITGNDAGMMQLELSAANTNRLGRMMLSITDAANHVPVVHEFEVVSAAYYDWKYGTTIPPVNTTHIGGTAQTGRDIGASVLVSSGTGTGQLDVTSGVIKANLAQILGTALTETAGQIAAGFRQFFNIASPTSTMNVITSVTTTATATTLTNAPSDSSGTTTLLSRLSSARAGYMDNLNVGGSVASSAEVTGLNVNTRCNLLVPQEIETPDSSTQTYKIRLHLFDQVGNMEAPDSTPTIALTNAGGTDRSGRLSSASNPSTGVYTWDYTATAGDAEEQLIWVFTVVEAGVTRTYPANSYVVEESLYRFSSSDRSNLNDIKSKTDSLTFTVTGKVDSNVTDWKGSTAPAMTGDAFARLGAPTGASHAADLVTIASYVDALETRLTATRAGYLDNLSGGSVALEATAQSVLDVADKLDTALELDGAVYRFTTNALEQAPSGGGGGGLDAAGVRAAIGLASANLDTQLADLPTNSELATALAAADDAMLTAIGNVQSDTNDIQSRIPAALVGGRMDSNMSAISGSATAADNLKEGAEALVPSACAAGSTTTSIVTNLTEATDDHYNGRVITFTSGVLAGQATSISDYNGTTKTLTVIALTEAPADTDSFVIS